MAAECREGCGAEGFYKTFSQEKDAGIILEKILATGRDKTEADQWQSQIFARIVHKFTVILVSAAEPGLLQAKYIDSCR